MAGDEPPRLRRRSTLLAAGGVLLTGCTSSSDRPQASPSSSSATTAPPSSRSGSAPPSGTTSSAPATSPLPRVTRWLPDTGELVPRAKLAAVRAIERRGNRHGAALQVIDAQYGGLLASAASVLVVTRTWHRGPTRLTQGGVTYDVRVRRGRTGWQVTAVHPSRPGSAHRLTSDERAVLRSDRIVLPPAAAADVRSGQVHDSVLAALRRVSEGYRIGVSVVRTGHPLHVFGTDRLSDHPRGRAFDTFMIDGRPVVHPGTPRRLVTGFMEAVAAVGSYNVGGPYLLGAAPQWFSDDTHHDHVHAGFAT